MAVPLETFVKQLTDSGIIAPGKLEGFIPPKASPKDAQQLARQLVQSRHLTKYQAQEIYQGRAKSLILGAYTVLDKIGAGGMGQVFKAQHRKMDRLVAIKMLPPAMMKDAAAAARFEREVRAAAKLRHPNIVAADDAAEANGVHFLVMEYVEGADLSALVKKIGPFSVSKAVNYTMQAARGLEFAHKKGVIHRDIKPANLLLDNEGVVKILDMGLARLSSEGDAATQAELTGTGAVMGTVDYMAPEQALDTKHADARADIYSLGCTLFFLLTGKPTYEAETITAKLLAHQGRAIPKLSKVRDEASDELAAVFEKMVAKKVEDRYQSMSEVVSALEQCSSDQHTLSIQRPVGMDLDNSAMTFLRDIPGLTTHKAKAATKKAVKPVTDGGSKNRRPLLIGAGAAGFLAVLLGVIVIIRNQKGEEVGRLELPPGHSAEVQETGAEAGKPSPLRLALVGPAPPLAKAPFDAAQAKAHQTAWARHLGTSPETVNAVGMRMTLVPPGEFLMGSTDAQVEAELKMAEELTLDQANKDRIQAERPQHRVVITKPFLMGTTEVTVGQFRAFVEATRYVTEAEQYGFADSPEKVLSDKVQARNRGLNWKSPGYAVTEQSPVSQITWNDACAFCNWLSERENATYRLPTEAEREYACRAGTTGQYSFGDDVALLDQYAWSGHNSGGQARPVATKLPNPFGLYDMHGNLDEWCQDFFGADWYEKTPANDPSGPVSGSGRVFRGGRWHWFAYPCRSAYRAGSVASYRGAQTGFRLVRVLDAQAESRLATTNPNKPWNTPAFQQWMNDVAAMPAEEQIKAVSKKLMELNPGFDGKLRDDHSNAAPKIEKGVVTVLQFFTDNVTDISPVRALAGLKLLYCGGSSLGKSKFSDLSPLAGMRLKDLGCHYTAVSDLSPLKGMPLAALNCSSTQVSDLSPLQGMPLSTLFCFSTPVSDLSPLKGMPLGRLICDHTQVSDLSSLMECNKLGSVQLYKSKVTASGIAALQKALPNCKIDWDGAAAKPLTTYKDPAFQQWMKDVQAMPADKQIEAVSKKLVELNPGFDGKITGFDAKDMPKVVNGVVRIIGIITDNVTDISPVRALMGVANLNCSGTGGAQGKFSDLSPLQEMKLVRLGIMHTQVSDLSPLRGMQLTRLDCDNAPIFDLSPLKGMPLTFLGLTGTPASDLLPLQGMPLLSLAVSAGASDLSPLEGMPLASLNCHNNTKVTDLSPLNHCKSLKLLQLHFTKLTLASVTALQEALPDCKIEWDGPAKVVAGQPTKPWNTPAFQTWMKDVAAMPADKQVEAVSKKLQELNPGFDGQVTGSGIGAPKIENGAVWDLMFNTDNVSDISPVRALAGLKVLNCIGSRLGIGKLSDLSPLQGMKLTRLACGFNSLSDFSPLLGMPLNNLHCGGTPVSDLSPLKQAKLSYLNCNTTQVSNLSALQGMPLTRLECFNTPIADVSALADCKDLTTLNATTTKVTAAGVGALQKALPNCKIDWDDPAKPKALATAAQVDPNRRAAEWVLSKGGNLNATFDGKSKKAMILGDLPASPFQVTHVWFYTINYDDPDLENLQGLASLTTLDVNQANVSISDKGLSVLASLDTLDDLHVVGAGLAGPRLTSLGKIKRLKRLEIGPLRDVDMGHLVTLTNLDRLTVNSPHVTDSGLATLGTLKNLTDLRLLARSITPAGIAALQKALPNCKIEWDDPAKAIMPAKPITTFKEPAFQQWRKDVAALAAEKQIDAVARKLVELNPGFDGKLTDDGGNGTPKIEKGLVTELRLASDNVTDLSPLRAFAGLKILSCAGSARRGMSQLSDLSPLDGMRLTKLACGDTQISDLSPLQGMPLRVLDCSGNKRITDLSPLQGMKLTGLGCNGIQVSDLSPLKGMPLVSLYLSSTPVSDLSPLEGMPLTLLHVGYTKVSDLSALRGMALATLVCGGTNVSDLSPLENSRTLGALVLYNTKVTPAAIAALQKKLPDCKIEWPAIDQFYGRPAATGTK